MKKLDYLIKKYHELWREGKEKDMIPYLKEAVELCKKENMIYKQIEILNEYAGVLRITGNYDEAIDKIDQAIYLFDNYKKDSVAYATTVMNKANIYRQKKDYYNAEKYMIESKKIFDEIKDTSYSYIGLLNNFSLLYQEIEDYENAKLLQEQAIYLLEKDDRYKVPLAISYNNLYQIQKKLNENLKAKENLLKAQDILQKEVGTSHPLYSSVLNNLADVSMSEKDYEKANVLYKKALDIVEKCYGLKSDAYNSVKSNYDFSVELLNNIKKNELKDGCSNNKLIFKCKKFSNEVRDCIYKFFPQIKDKICLALVGSGSQCLFFDDFISSDHDYEIMCQLFLENYDYKKYKDELEKIFKNNLKNKVEIYSIDVFYTYYTSYPQGPKTIQEYKNVPDEYMCSATNGMVFLDNLGKFSSIRNRLLLYYPQDLIYKKLAYHLNNIAQSGQYNYNRMLLRKDVVACNLALSEFIKHYIQVVHILNKKYMPFYKWSHKNLGNMKILGDYTSKKLITLLNQNDDEKINTINEMCKMLVEILNKEKITNSKIDFLTYQAQEVMKKIKDEMLSQQDSWIN